jgi:HEAT repeat protein
MATLIEALDDAQEVIRAAARECLAEFNFTRYLAAFDAMEEDVRRSTGQLVTKVEPHAPRLLIEELQSPTRSRRLRAAAVAEAMQLVPSVEDELHKLLADEDHMIRAASASALAQSRTERTRQMLREALLDNSVAVHNAAEHALEEIALQRSTRPVGIDLGAISLPESGIVLFGS